MRMNRVAVDERVLRWAIERSALTAADLAHEFPRIHEWITGDSLPTLGNLEALAAKTLTPLGFFFLDEPPDERLPVPHFRTLREASPARPSPELLQTVWTMQRRQDWLREYMLEAGEDPLSFVGSVRVDEAPEKIAERMRRDLGLSVDWAANLPTWERAVRTLHLAMEESGMIVVVSSILGNNTHRKLKVEEFRGFVLVDAHVPIAFVNGADSKAAQMFTLAHELAHVFVGSSAAFDLRQLQPAADAVEQACNLVAAEFLVPGERLCSIWPSVASGPEPLQSLAYRFKVSAIVAARRALDLALIGWDEFLEFYNAREQARPAKQAGGGDFYAMQNLRVGRRLASAVIQAVETGQIPYSHAFRLTGLYGRAFDGYASLIRSERGS